MFKYINKFYKIYGIIKKGDIVNVLYEDNAVIVVYKDYGILSQKDISEKDDMLSLVKDYIKIKYNKPGEVYLGLLHRLDINTEGIMVFARNSKAAKRISDDIKNNKFNKEYIAVCEGKLKNKHGILKNNIYKDEKERKAYIKPEGKEAILEYNVVNESVINNQIVSYVHIKLITGRFHQIRCQFSNIGHPLYGDEKYGSKNNTNHSVLQAYKLEFFHPIKKEKISFKLIDNDNNFKNLEMGDL